ncbi:hypothetical protein CLOSTMETH_00346 [[Clostridium] methylpentosum DSM 5476]|uniref:Uncharacterized protein n=1 Tax=[Clostridium] methylpentosum DSM 5476 TaxID=537013 RepID=C0E951_9FIRM|nr:hypothetical protein CLOSTMETH_00346 [[Clostridium] methylpentosum DSM 5476]
MELYHHCQLSYSYIFTFLYFIHNILQRCKSLFSIAQEQYGYSSISFCFFHSTFIMNNNDRPILFVRNCPQ